MITEREVVEVKPVEKAPTAIEENPPVAVSMPQPELSVKLFIASNICLLAGLVVMAIALMLPAGILSTVLIAFPMSVTLSLTLLIIEVSLFVVGAILFAWGFIWPRIKWTPESHMLPRLTSTSASLRNPFVYCRGDPCGRPGEVGMRLAPSITI